MASLEMTGILNLLRSLKTRQMSKIFHAFINPMVGTARLVLLNIVNNY